MANEKLETVVIGGGQAGLAASRHLSERGVSHVVLERHRIAERWRAERWDSLVANGPAWHDRFPDLEFSEIDPNVDGDAFPGKDCVADYFEAYAKKFKAPMRCGVEVRDVRRHTDRAGFFVETTDGSIDTSSVIVATGPFQNPVIPNVIPADAPVNQMHSSAYRNPNQLSPGGVIVVGTGSSGSQIADELLQSGREVYLSVGPHDRPPRRYRGFDFVWWLGVLGKWDIQAQSPGTEHVTIAVSGAEGGRTVDFRRLAGRGMSLVGRTQSFFDGMLTFAPDLADNIRNGDANYLSVLDEADAYVARTGLDLVPEPEAHLVGPDPECMTSPILELDLVEAGIGTVIWATGFTQDFSWLNVDAFDVDGRPQHQRGISSEPGIYFLGLPWLSGRGSSFIWGVWHDARYVADHIVTQQSYLDHYRSQRDL